MKKTLFILFLLAGLGRTTHAGTFTEYHTILCGAIIELGPVGYLNWNPATVIKEPVNGDVFIFTNQPYPDSMFYKSDYGYLGQDTFIVACAHATQITCDTGIYIITVAGCPPLYVFTETHEIACDSTLLIPGLGYPVWVTPEIEQPPKHGTAYIQHVSSLDKDTLVYTPEPGFSGADTVIVNCAHATQITCETGIYVFEVSCLNTVKYPVEEPSLIIFPNPAWSTLTVKSALPIERLELASCCGAMVRICGMNSPLPEAKIDVHDLPPGCYFLTIWRGDKKVSRLIVIGR